MLDDLVPTSARRANKRKNLPTWQRPRFHSDSEPRAYVRSLATEALNHHAVLHPYLEDLGAGRLPDPESETEGEVLIGAHWMTARGVTSPSCHVGSSIRRATRRRPRSPSSSP